MCVVEGNMVLKNSVALKNSVVLKILFLHNNCVVGNLNLVVPNALGILCVL